MALDKASALRKMATIRDNFKSKLGERFVEINDAIEASGPQAPESLKHDALNNLLHYTHKLRGAAATFDLGYISDVAGKMEDMCKQVLAEGRPLKPTEYDGLTALFLSFNSPPEGPENTESYFDAVVWEDLHSKKQSDLSDHRGRNTIILVDDDLSFIEILENQLGHFGFDVVSLIDHSELAEAIKKTPPAAIVMDVAFPDDADAGVNTIHRLRGNGLVNCPVVFLSVRMDIEARLSAVRAECDDYMGKPVDIAELIDVLDRLTKHASEDPYRILVVDDDIDVAQFNAALLTKGGMEAVVVTDPMKIMEPLNELRPDVILMDVAMPGCDGFELAKVIRQDKNFIQTPIVFLTGTVVENAWLLAMQAGGDEFLRKNIPQKELITSVLARARRTRDLHAITSRLGESELRFRAVSESAHEAIVTTDKKGNILYWNRSAGDFFGYESADILGRCISTLIPEPFLTVDADGLTIGVAGQSDDPDQGATQAYGRCKDGHHLPIEVSLSDWSIGDHHYFTTIIRDVTAHLEAEKALIAARQEAENANQAKSDFLASMSHELRTPMNAILGFAQMLNYNPKEPLTPNQKESTDLIMKGGEHLLELINDILDLAKIESGKIDLNLKTVSPLAVMHQCLDLIGPLAEKNDIQLRVPDLGGAVKNLHTDETRFTQVLLNLMSNAVKYNRVGRTVIVDCDVQPNNTLRISVTDEGYGISPENIKKLFKPFSRLGAESSDIEGTGIGLVVCKNLVKLLGGALGVSSTLGTGSTFWVEIPLAIEEDEFGGVVAVDMDPADESLPSIHGTLLYVEDNPSNVHLMEMMVGSVDGLFLRVAINGEDGVALARELRPDVIVLDIDLPGISGFEALDLLKSFPETKDIPTLAFSASATQEDINRGLQAGFLRYLTKPVQVSEFMNAIKDAIN